MRDAPSAMVSECDKEATAVEPDDTGSGAPPRNGTSWFTGARFATIRRQTSTWRFIVASGLAIASAVLILNIVVLIWARTTHSDDLLFQGDCGRAKSIVTWSSLAINALSTLLLGASNAAMQCLCAPTREDVDRVHAMGKWLEIGVSGLGNLKSVERWRRYAWAAILISSVPLHLLYNSVIYSTSQANEYVALLVTADFTTGSPPFSGLGGLNQSTISDIDTRNTQGYAIWSDGPNSSNVVVIADLLQGNITNLQRLDNSDCIRTYGTDYVTDFLNVLLVTESPSPANGSAIAAHEYFPAKSDSFSNTEVLDYSWICSGNTPCDTSSQIATASDWSITLQKQNYPISYCLAQTISPQCTIQILPPVLVVVIICNVLKVLFFSVLLFRRNFAPLMLFGDAIASFMTKPDPVAITCGPSGAEAIFRMYIAEPLRFSTNQNSRRWVTNRARHQIRTWHVARRRWASAVGRKRWLVTVLGFLTLWFIGFAFLYQEQSQGTTVSFATFWTQGFGTPYPLATVQLGPSSSVMGIAVLANLPQISLSVIYLTYNDVFTCMLASAEFLRHAHEQKGLRVTLPHGEQRGSYTLSLPFKVSVPLLIGSGVLHWAMSQSLFLARVDVIDMYGHIDPHLSFSALGWSALALLLLLLVWGIMLVVVLVSGTRRFPCSAPPVGSNSRAMLSAAGFTGDGASEAKRKVRYGVIESVEGGFHRVGLSSGEVGELEELELYA